MEMTYAEYLPRVEADCPDLRPQLERWADGQCDRFPELFNHRMIEQRNLELAKLTFANDIRRAAARRRK